MVSTVTMVIVVYVLMIALLLALIFCARALRDASGEISALKYKLDKSEAECRGMRVEVVSYRAQLKVLEKFGNDVIESNKNIIEDL